MSDNKRDLQFAIITPDVDKSNMRSRIPFYKMRVITAMCFSIYVKMGYLF